MSGPGSEKVCLAMISKLKEKGPVLKSFMRQVAIIDAHGVFWKFGFCKRCMVFWYLPQEAQKKLCAFFVNVLWCTISS